MRNLFVLIHRWAGLFTAVFLFIAGLTGAVISWDHELDEWLNPHLFDARITDPNAAQPVHGTLVSLRAAVDRPLGGAWIERAC